MRKIKKYILFFSLVLISSNVFATYGCYIRSSGRVYTSPKGGSGKWRSSPSVNIGTNACWGSGTEQSCKVSGIGYGILGDYSVAYCPIDDYVWVLMVGSLVLAVGFIRKRIYIPLN